MHPTPASTSPASGSPSTAASVSSRGADMNFGVKIPFVELLGFDLVKFEGGESEIAYEPKPEHLNSFSVAHGGVCMTLLDVAMAAAARSVDQQMGVVTIEMKTSFMQPARGMLA